MVDLGGGVVPGEDGVLGPEPGEGDEVLGLGHVHGLPVDPGRDPDDGAAGVAERDRVHRLLHRAEVPRAVLRDRHHPRRHCRGRAGAVGSGSGMGDRGDGTPIKKTGRRTLPRYGGRE